MPLTLPFLPDWVPWWVTLAIVVVAILFGFAFLMMPFAVFGLRGRLDMLEAQLDDIHAELRMLATRLPEADRRPARSAPREPVAEVEDLAPSPRLSSRPPVPPPPAAPRQEPPLPLTRRPREVGDWSSPPPASRPSYGQAPQGEQRYAVPSNRPAETPPVDGPPSYRPPQTHPLAVPFPDDSEPEPARRPIRAVPPRRQDPDRSEPTLRWPPPR